MSPRTSGLFLPSLRRKHFKIHCTKRHFSFLFRCCRFGLILLLKMQFFIVTNIFNHKMNSENVKEVICPHKLLCFEVLNIKPVLYSSREWSKNCWEAIRIITSKPASGTGERLWHPWRLPGRPPPRRNREKCISDVLWAQRPKAVVLKVCPQTSSLSIT